MAARYADEVVLSTPFLRGFSRAVLAELIAQGQIETMPGHEEAVALFVAEYLGAVPSGGSLITSLARALILCPHVEELYADDQTLKQVVQELQSTPATWVRS